MTTLGWLHWLIAWISFCCERDTTEGNADRPLVFFRNQYTVVHLASNDLLQPFRCVKLTQSNGNNTGHRWSSSIRERYNNTQNNKPIFIVLANSSSMLVWHFSRFILFMATRSCLGVQRAACTTAVAPLPGITDTTQPWQSGRERRRGTRSAHTAGTQLVKWASLSGVPAFAWPSCSCVYVTVSLACVPPDTSDTRDDVSWVSSAAFCLMGCFSSIHYKSGHARESDVVHTEELRHTAYCLPTVGGR